MLNSEQVSNRIAWVNALLSGDYPQGHGRLHDHLGWCCLGVAGNALEPGAEFVSAENLRHFLPNEWAMEKLGLTLSNGVSDQFCAGVWNDKYHYTFEEIADRVALATERGQSFHGLNESATNHKFEEFGDGTPGDYARAWLTRQTNSS